MITPIIDWLAAQGGMVTLLMFFVLFLTFAYWAFRPGNKQRMEVYGQIPLRENEDGQ